MSIELQTRKYWAVENTLQVAGTAEIMGQGGANDTFVPTAKFIEIGYVDYDCYIAPTEDALSETADGSDHGLPIFIKAETVGRIIPWEAKDVWFINSEVGETPTLHIVGLF